MSKQFIKIQPSNGIIHDKQGKTAGLIWIFRPSIAMKDRHWFEEQINNRVLCIETGPDEFPINCKAIYPNLDGPNEWGPLADKEILKVFEVCCKLLLKEHNEMQKLGNKIFEDMLSGDAK